MNVHIFNYILSYFPVDKIYLFSLVNKALKAKIKKYWKPIVYFNFKFILSALLAVKYTKQRYRELCFSKKDHYNSISIPKFRFWNSKTRIHRYINSLIYNRKKKLLKYTVLNNNIISENKRLIYIQCINYGLIDICVFMDSKIEVNYSQLLFVVPINQEAMNYCLEKSIPFKSYSDIEKFQNYDSFLFSVKHGYDYMDYTHRAINNNQLSIIKYIFARIEIENDLFVHCRITKKLISCFHYFGYKFTTKHLRKLFSLKDSILIFCIENYGHEFISKDEVFHWLKLKQRGSICSSKCKKIVIDNNYYSSLLFHNCCSVIEAIPK